MNYNFEYIDIILFAMIAGFIALRLRDILGRKSGHEKKDLHNQINRSTVDQDFKPQTRKPLVGDLDEKAKADFLKGAKLAYEMIITSFAKGEKSALKPLVNKEIFQNFSNEIERRKNQNLKSELTFIGLKSVKINSFEKKDNIYIFTVNFVSEIITCLRDKENKILEGSLDEIKTVNDTWKFSKNMWSSNPNWILTETEI
tara:strand:- start:661 stop:1260 length:600 start_codon:yes stop_codon:yes gene_type:complete